MDLSVIKDEWLGSGFAKQFLKDLPVIPVQPDIYISCNGTICIEWLVGKDRHLTVFVWGNGETSYTGVLGKSEQSGFEDLRNGTPETIIALIKRVLL